MARRVTAEEVLERAAGSIDPPLVAIDGLPCSGKSTLAGRLQDEFGFECVYLDDFVLPRSEWPSDRKPAFPFRYIRYNEFLDTIRSLSMTGKCAYAPFDWQTMAISKATKEIVVNKPVLIEGVSSLNDVVCHLYGLRIFVDGDRATTLEAALARGAGRWAAEWQEWFLPSVDLYMKSRPKRRADLIVVGRGAR
jgi:uridine kinase